MRNSLKGVLAATVMLAPMMASAGTLIGEWTGNATDVFPTYDGPQVIDLDFLTQTPDGSAFALTGKLAATCVNSPDPGCGTQGVFVSFTASLAANDSVTITAANGALFGGTVSVDDNRLTGTVTAPGTKFSADYALSKVVPNAAPEMNPTSAVSGLALLVGGLLVVRGRKRQVVAS